MTQRSLLDFALGLLFGLFLAIPVRAQLRPMTELKESTAPEMQDRRERAPSPSLSAPVEALETRTLDYFGKSDLSTRRTYTENEKTVIEDFLSKWTMHRIGPAKTLTFQLKLKIRFPSDWTIHELEQGQKFEVTSDDKVVRVTAFLARRGDASKAQFVNDYIKLVKAHSAGSQFQLLKGPNNVLENWSQIACKWLTRSNVNGNWVFQRRFMVFSKDSVIILNLSSWQKTFVVWDPFFLNLTRELEDQAFVNR